MKIAILGATSQIAKDLIISLSESDIASEVCLFSRAPEKVINQFKLLNKKIDYPNLPYTDFKHNLKFDVILNFVGIGDPAEAKKMGDKIFKITEQFDNLALNYLRAYPDCKYVFLSSGAVFGNDFFEPVNETTNAVFNVNNLGLTNWYSVAKFYAEAKHRAMDDFNIVDIRVFNYFSATQNFESHFLMSDIAQSILQKTVLLTSPENITRDFITPVDFFQLFEKVINEDSNNLAIDAYTREPIDKLTLLKELKSKYGLMYEFVSTGVGVNATGFKRNYYSTNRKAEELGYFSKLSSLEGIFEQFDKLLTNRAQSK